MTKTSIGNVAFFVCGTPSDKRGFEYAALGPAPLPGNPAGYLDRRLKTRKHVSYDIEIISVGQSQAAVYAQSYPINPNDSEINRGAFLAVGFVCTTSPSLHFATHCISHVGTIAANLRSHLQPNNTLAQGFRLKAFRHAGLRTDLLDTQCSPLLRADLLLQAAHRTGRFAHHDSFTFGDRDFPADAALGDHLVYTGADALAIQSLEVERERVAQLAETAARAAALAENEQKNWRAFQQGAQRELEAFVDRKADFDAILEQLQKQSEATKAIAKPVTTGTRLQQLHRTNRTADDTKPPERRPQRHATRIANKPRTVGTNATFIAIIAVSIALLSTLVYFRNRLPDTFEPTTNIAEAQREGSFIEPAIDETQTTPDIVRQRAALDGPPESNPVDARPES